MSEQLGTCDNEVGGLSKLPHRKFPLCVNWKPLASSLAPSKAGEAEPTLAELLESARHHVMTPEEKEAQRQSWVRGEMALGEAERGMTSLFPPAQREAGEGLAIY